MSSSSLVLEYMMLALARATETLYLCVPAYAQKYMVVFSTAIHLYQPITTLCHPRTATLFCASLHFLHAPPHPVTVKHSGDFNMWEFGFNPSNNNPQAAQVHWLSGVSSASGASGALL
ncbi:hypothetical protein VE02_10242 [Pseudogymnoascus sp. 03VT05]|nr:hypothetical protein VE02_10242 [Pseudogymnoascus sp. 03VT05]